MQTRNRIGLVAVAVVVAAAGVGIGLAAVGTSSAAAKRPALEGNGSIDEAWLTGAGPGDHITLTRNGATVTAAGASDTADPLGSLIVRNLTPGSGYQWDDQTTDQTTASFTVLTPGRNPGPTRPSTPASPCTKG